MAGGIIKLCHQIQVVLPIGEGMVRWLWGEGSEGNTTFRVWEPDLDFQHRVPLLEMGRRQWCLGLLKRETKKYVTRLSLVCQRSLIYTTFTLNEETPNARNPHFTQHRRHRPWEPGGFMAGRAGRGLGRELWLPFLWTLFAGTSKT